MPLHGKETFNIENDDEMIKIHDWTKSFSTLYILCSISKCMKWFLIKGSVVRRLFFLVWFSLKCKKNLNQSSKIQTLGISHSEETTETVQQEIEALDHVYNWTNIMYRTFYKHSVWLILVLTLFCV